MSGMRRFRWPLLYTALLLASHLAQAFDLFQYTDLPGTALEIPPGAAVAQIDPDAGGAQRASIWSPVFTSDGRAAGAERIRFAYLEFLPDSAPANPPTIVALHGSPGRGRDLSRLARHLTGAGYRVIAPDLPGFGESERWIPDYSIRAHARYTLHLLDALGIRSAHVFGHSMGSGVAQEMWRLAPERLQSLTIYGGIGIQEGEGSGDYYIEHAKYTLGYAFLVMLPEVVPHFGFFGPRSFRHAFIRNFFDSDQRPLRSVLANIDVPVLILHGAHDPLVPAWAAEEHHRLVPGSELLMLDASHFMVFRDEASGRLASEVTDFLNRRQQEISSGTLDRTAGRTVRESSAHLEQVELPVHLELGPRLGAYATVGAIIGGTFVSEDLTCISAGLLIRANRLDVFTGILGCFVGIFLGDLGLYFMGKAAGIGLLRNQRVQRWLPAERLERLARRFDREGWKLIFLARFVPGMRFPVYTGAGLIGGRAGRLVIVALLAGIIWTPMLVLLAALLGQAIIAPIEYVTGEGVFALLAGIVLVYLAIRLFVRLLTRNGRRRLYHGLRRWSKIEFWPPWLFYAPLVPWGLYFQWRYRFGSMTAANPGIEYGGLIGESKAAILDQLPEAWVLPYLYLPPLTSTQNDLRAQSALDHMRAKNWNFPIILKPDAAQRGVGLKLARNETDVVQYFEKVPAAVVLQVYHPGPFEAGVFYYRMPDEAEGRIFSITDKEFPVVVGDGSSSLEELIWRHPRFAMQADRFFERHEDRLDDVPAPGESVRLAIAGNHMQGTIFRDGNHLYSAALQRLTDEIARGFAGGDERRGFFFGRFDVRYSDVEKFKNGEEFGIVELNGATSESTNIYDPDASFGFVYRTLFRQWDLMMRIGRMNVERGAEWLSLWGIAREIIRYQRKRTRMLTGD